MTALQPDTLAGLPVLFVMAADAEYGPALRARINPLMTGVGPVEGGVALAAALAVMAQRPRLIVSLGSAGSARLEQARVYQVGAVAYRDMDASPLGFARGLTPFLDLPARIDLPHRIPGLPLATLSTGGAIVSGPAYAAIPEDMVDMETFAHLRAAMRFGIPLIGIYGNKMIPAIGIYGNKMIPAIGLRGISDGAADLDDLDGLHDWTQYLHVIDERLAAAVDLLEQALAAGVVRP